MQFVSIELSVFFAHHGPVIQRRFARLEQQKPNQNSFQLPPNNTSEYQVLPFFVTLLGAFMREFFSGVKTP